LRRRGKLGDHLCDKQQPLLFLRLTLALLSFIARTRSFKLSERRANGRVVCRRVIPDLEEAIFVAAGERSAAARHR